MVQRYHRGLTLTERRLIRRIVYIIAAAGVAWLIFAPGRGLLYYHRLHKRIDALTQQNKSLAARNEELRKEIERLQNDEAYLEEMARQKYDLLKENETVYEFKHSGKKN